MKGSVECSSAITQEENDRICVYFKECRHVSMKLYITLEKNKRKYNKISEWQSFQTLQKI